VVPFVLSWHVDVLRRLCILLCKPLCCLVFCCCFSFLLLLLLFSFQCLSDRFPCRIQPIGSAPIRWSNPHYVINEWFIFNK
jgi:hypothetical protein